MRQPIKGMGKIKRTKPIPKKIVFNNQPYGTSKLERDFAKQYLDANGVKYIYQYEAPIGRYYDFAVVKEQERKYIMENKDGLRCIKQQGQGFTIDFLIEIDGGYFHGDPRVVKEGKLNQMQKHNRVVDGIKDQWASLNCIPLLRLWEKDIRENKPLVMEKLSKMIDIKAPKKTVPQTNK